MLNIGIFRYSIANESDYRLRYDECSFLLAIAFADNAFYGCESYDDLLEQEIPEEDDFVQLQWKEEAKLLPILRHVKSDGTVTTKPMKR